MHGGHLPDVVLVLQQISQHVLPCVPVAAHGDDLGQGGQQPRLMGRQDHLRQHIARQVGPEVGGTHGHAVGNLQAHDLRRTQNAQIDAREGGREAGADPVPEPDPRLVQIPHGQGGEVRQLGGALGFLAAQGGGDGRDPGAHKPQPQGVLRGQVVATVQALRPDRICHLPVEPGGGLHLVRIGQPDPVAGQVDAQHGDRQQGSHHAVKHQPAPLHAVPPAAQQKDGASGHGHQRPCDDGWDGYVFPVIHGRGADLGRGLRIEGDAALRTESAHVQ